MLIRILYVCLGLLVFAKQLKCYQNDVYAQQPKIITQDGHLIFMTADNHNITFQSKGSGSININGDDLTAIVLSAKRSIAELSRIKEDDLVTLQSGVSQIQIQLNNLNQLMDRVNDIEASINRLQDRATRRNNTAIQRNILRNQQKLRTDLRQLTTKVKNIEKFLQADDCASNPCKNGGTCTDAYKGYSCNCPPNWEGATCEMDINECVQFIGTTLGCQNGATCFNTIGSYSCQCPPDWHGIHCTERHDDCSTASHLNLCEHGTCINQQRVQQGQSRYTCICDEGWTTDGHNPACNVDINECDGGNSRCSQHPYVQCINLPGSFRCGHCPSGYTGNGYSCSDINECLTNNGGCSLVPYVQCINTQGSRQCGPCPPGFQGNGETCTYVGICQVNNGGCHRLATCVENPALSNSQRDCYCPQGYSGPGYGPQGCVYQGSGSGTQQGPSAGSSNACDSNPCVRGTCVNIGVQGFRCNCPLGYTGILCDMDVNECSSSPCLNGATCVDQPNGYRCLCTSRFFGTNCEREEDACGGRLTQQQNGTLHYPSNPSLQYQHGKSCAWIITTTSSKVLNITFTEFHLENSTECSYDYLRINDGPTANSHPIGTFCGHRLPKGGNIITTHNSVYMWFHSDRTISGDGFGFSWNSIDPICGGILPTAEYGQVSSPGYPGPYPRNRDCVWVISVPVGKRMQLTHATLKLEHNENCSYDFLEIRDGASERDSVLATYCSTMNPPPLVTSGSFARLYFHTDGFLSDTGFQITYNSMPGIHGCGGILTSDQGAFSTPDFPNQYQHNLNCEWLIRMPANERVRLKFESMDLEYHSGCRWDYVEVFDGSDDSALSFGRICGRQLPSVYASTGNALFVKFSSDHSFSHGGFRATYASVCGGVFTDLQGLLHSPYYPNPYPRSKECVYLIHLPPGNAVQLSFVAFDIEGPSAWCYFDYLEIRDGESATSRSLGRFCGTQIPEPITSTFNILRLKFVTDASLNNRGFLANYTSISTGCGGIILNATTGTISSPNHPEEYMHNSYCRWIIRPQAGYVIRLSFITFILENDRNCNYDYLAVYDNTTTEDDNKLIGKYCGHQLPPSLISSDNLMFIVFHTDDSVSRDGFSLHYMAISAASSCGGEFYTRMGRIRSPGFPNSYSHGRTCIWKISAPVGQQIHLNVTYFNLEQGADCRYDSLEIRNGGYETSPQIGKYCGTQIPKEILSHSNQLWLKFVSDASVVAPGFDIVWDGTKTGCGGELSAASGTIISPGYPVTCTIASSCMWRIKSSRGNSIKLRFLDLDIPSSPNCNFGGIQVFRGASSRTQLIKTFCGTETPSDIILSSEGLFIVARCGAFVSRGFQIAYSTECNNQLRGRRGVLESPNFPGPYPNDRNCTWRITAPRGSKVNISFAVLNLEHSASCQHDFIEVRQVDMNRTTLGHYCGSMETPPHLFSTTNEVEVQFMSDYTVANNGFLLEWVADGCGGELRKPSGNFTSPGYPFNYPVKTTCEWEIEVAPGNSIELTIQEYDMEGHDNCNFDVLRVYSGSNANSIPLTSLCYYQTSPVTILSPDNRMYVQFISDVSVSAKGFRASYVSKPGGCGGQFTTPLGTIYSRNFPNHYNAKDDCTWLIRVNPGHTVFMEFTNFNVPPPYGCTDAYVAIYDGPTENDTLIMKHCGPQLPPSANYTSTGNQVLIRMKANVTQTAEGFKMNYYTGCGATLYADEPGEISFSRGVVKLRQLSQLQNLRESCTWIIRARNLEDTITFTTTQYFISPWATGISCIRVYDGETNSSQILQTVCNNTIPPSVTSSGASLRVVGTSFFGSSRFRAVYHESSMACGGEIKSLHGWFASPNYPHGYPVQTECIWIIKSSPGNKVMLDFSDFELEDSDYCNQDYVEIRETNSSGRLLERYCGTSMPTSNSTASNQLWIKFRSDDEGVAKGFLASYSLMRNSDIRGTNGQIANPSYPHRDSGHTQALTWTITVPAYQYIKVQLIEFSMSGYRLHLQCLKIYGGVDTTAALLKEYCDRSTREPVFSTSNTMHITLTPMRSATFLFLLEWQAISNLPFVPFIPTSPIPSTSTAGCNGDIYLNSSYFDYYGNTFELVSPGYPNGYQNNMRCEWIFTSESLMSVGIRFSHLEMENYMNCRADYIELWGATMSGEWEPLGRYCLRSSENFVQRSYGGALKVNFATDWSVTKAGFRAQLFTVCGGNFSVPSGVIMAPTYLQSYYNNINCQWLISVRPGRTIQVRFEEFEVEGDSPACNNDYVILRNGMTLESPLLGAGKFCGTTIPQPLETMSNHLFVQFRSNYAVSMKGFKLVFNEVSIECGGVRYVGDNSPSTTIETPNFPQTYPINCDCQWRIVGPPGKRLQLHFEDHFDIPYELDCPNDYLSIYDGGTINSARLATLCGSHSPPGTIQTTSNVLFAKFSSTTSHPSTGFRARITIGDCGGTIIADEGLLSSPNYPHGYIAGLDCEWIIRGHSGHFLLFNFVDLATESRSNNCSASDFVEIRESNSTGLRLGIYCGNRLPGVIQTADNVAYIRFRTQQASSLIGFKLNFNISIEECGGEMIAPNGVITSPNFPRPYQKRRLCRWVVRAMVGRKVRITFTHFDLGSSSWACTSGVHLFNGPTDEYPILPPYTLCGNDIPSPVESSSNSMTVVFFSSNTVLGTGFRAVYDTDLEWDCGGELPVPSGNLSSPGYDNGTYLHNMHCNWNLISQNPNASFLFRIQEFHLERAFSGRCIHDILEFRGGSDETGMLFLSLCGNISVPQVFVIPSPEIYLHFRTDSSIAHTGFFLSYDTVVNCGGQILSGDSFINSPGYPSNYENDVHCTWTIEFQEGQQVSITFQEFLLENSANCTKDYVIIRNGITTSSPSIGGRRCGNVRPSDIITQGHTALIEFHTDLETFDRGFKLLATPVTAGCGGLFHGSSGQIKSFHYPSKYSNNEECEWILEGEPGFVFKLNFIERFDIEMHSSCSNDYLELFDFKDGQWLSRGRKCGREMPPMVISKSNKFRLLFRSNDAINGDGFKISWINVCGGVFTDNEGTIQTPNYPGNYPNNLDCEYLITADTNHYLSLTFDEEFGLESSPQCKYDVLEIFAGNDTQSESLLRKCDTEAPLPISHKGPILVHFFSDPSVTNKGFRMRYELSECGGFFTELSGEIASPLHPMTYHPNMNCTWVIIGSPDKVISLKFKSFNVERGGEQCIYDYVSIYDGNSTMNKHLGKFCGEVAPSSIKSTGSNMTLEFITDHEVHRGGFVAAYKVTYGERNGCGGLRNASSGMLQSLDYDNDGNYEEGLECVWVIMVEPLKVIQLTFERFDLEKPENSEQCPWDFVEIRDGLSDDSYLISIFCGNTLPPPITSSSNHLWIRFASDYSYNKPGFYATYIAKDLECGGLVNVNTTAVVIQSPNYPQNYGLNMRCQWILDSNDNNNNNHNYQLLQITFDDFNLQNSTGCQKDYLSIEGIRSSYYFVSFGSSLDANAIKHCGSNTPRNIFTYERTVRLYFASDSSVTAKGFSASVSVNPCNRTFTAPGGAVQFSGMTSTEWRTCVDTISVAEGLKITLSFTNFEFYPYDSCQESVLEVRDGLNENATLLGTFCGYNVPNPIFSTGNNLFLKMVKRPTDSFQHFTAHYYTTDKEPGCGGQVTATEGYIFSPFYPGNYSRDSECVWTLTAAHNKLISITFNTFDILSANNCSSNYLVFYNGLSAVESHQIALFCADDSPAEVRSTTNYMTIKYVTDTSNAGNGFRIHFSTIEAPDETSVEEFPKPSET